jgi:hypothetical protein
MARWMMSLLIGPSSICTLRSVLVFGKWIAAVQAVEDLHRVFLRLQIDDHQVEVLLDLQLFGFQPVAVKGHQHRAVAKGAALVHAPAARGGGDLALVGQFHLAADGHFQIIHAVEGARGQHADGRAG